MVQYCLVLIPCLSLRFKPLERLDPLRGPRRLCPDKCAAEPRRAALEGSRIQPLHVVPPLGGPPFEENETDTLLTTRQVQGARKGESVHESLQDGARSDMARWILTIQRVCVLLWLSRNISSCISDFTQDFSPQFLTESIP